MADVLTESPAGAALDLSAPAREAEMQAVRSGTSGDVLKARMPQLVKGSVDPYAPTDRQNMDVMMKAHQATLDLRTETYRGYNDKTSVVKGMSSDFLNQRGYLKTALSAPSVAEQVQQLVGLLPGGADALKSFTAGNLGIGSVSK